MRVLFVVCLSLTLWCVAACSSGINVPDEESGPHYYPHLGGCVVDSLTGEGIEGVEVEYETGIGEPPRTQSLWHTAENGCFTSLWITSSERPGILRFLHKDYQTRVVPAPTAAPDSTKERTYSIFVEMVPLAKQ